MGMTLGLAAMEMSLETSSDALGCSLLDGLGYTTNAAA